MLSEDFTSHIQLSYIETEQCVKVCAALAKDLIFSVI